MTDKYKAYAAGFEAGKEAGKLAALQELGLDPNATPKPSRNRYVIQAFATDEGKTSDAETQNARILSFLKNGGRLTPKDALRMFGSFRLSARIFELREQGWPIESVWVQVGPRQFVAEFFLTSKTKQRARKNKTPEMAF